MAPFAQNSPSHGASPSGAFCALRQASGYSGVGEIIYRYDGAGNRMSKSVSGAVSSYYYSGDQEILETDGSGAAVRRYVRLPGSVDEPLAMIDYTLASGCGGALPLGCVRYAHQDRLGSVIAVSDGSDGELEALFSYSPYGMSGTEGDAGFPFRFTGQKVEAETGLYYYKARYYDPEIGRFLQTDPVGYEDQQNWYAYTGNDPINNVDPTGRQTITSQLAIQQQSQRRHALQTGGSEAFHEVVAQQAAINSRDAIIVGVAVTPVDEATVLGAVIGGGLLKFGRGIGEAIKSFKQGRKLFNDRRNLIFNRIDDEFNRGKPGGLANAIERELTTGELVGGKSHLRKGGEALKFVRRQRRQINNSHSLSRSQKAQLLDKLSDFADEITDAQRAARKGSR